MWGEYEPVLVYGFTNFSGLEPEELDSLVHYVVEDWEESNQENLLVGSIDRFVTAACKGRGYGEVWGVQLKDPFEGAKDTSVHVAVSAEIEEYVHRTFYDVQALLANREEATVEKEEEEAGDEKDPEDEEAEEKVEDECAPRLRLCLVGDIE